MSFRCAVVQLTTTSNPVESVLSAERLVERAKTLGADFVALPENVSFMGTEEQKVQLAEALSGPTFQRFGALAKRLGIWLLAGTLPEKTESPGKAYNTSALFGPDGTLFARYRKIHLFDVSLGEGATHRESSSVEPGSSPVLAETPLARFGMSVCYDLRFPDLYRALVRTGAEVLLIPAAFTVPTGRDHWEILLRARAIENQCYVVAPGQFGANTETRRTFGRSMIIDPWGTVLATCPDEPSVAVAEIYPERIASLRKNLPCLSHERLDVYRSVERFPKH